MAPDWGSQEMFSTYSIGKMTSLAALLGLLAAIPAAGQFVQEPPPELSFLSTILKVRKNIVYEAWGEVKYPPYGEGVVRQGKHWTIFAETAHGTDQLVEWNKVKPAFLQNGWTVVKEIRSGAFVEVLQYAKNGVQAWANVDPSYVPLIRLDVIEVGPLPFTFVLPTPAATPEKIAADKGDFPYLPPLPGSKFHGGAWDNTPYRVLPRGATQEEIVANGTLQRLYDFPGISNVMLTTAYRDALTKGGWEIVQEWPGGIKAHYAQRGRNIWAMVSAGAAESGYYLNVADAGAVDLGANLAKACHVALYGVLFDFNKSTLQPSSDAVLQPVANMMAADKTPKLEVQGHTDNVGNDAYNQTLSEARAKSVVTWLTQHGVAVDRLTAKGYGKTKPVADNGSDDGRAKNRRVEIADPRCSPKGN